MIRLQLSHSLERSSWWTVHYRRLTRLKRRENRFALAQCVRPEAVVSMAPVYPALCQRMRRFLLPMKRSLMPWPEAVRQAGGGGGGEGVRWRACH